MSQSQISTMLIRAGHSLQGTYNFATLVLGGFSQDWALRLVNWSNVPYWIIGLVVVLVPLKLYLKRRARHYLPMFQTALTQVTDGTGNIVIGGLGVAWFNLAVGLSPFFIVAPITIGVVILYFGLIVDVFFLKRVLRKAVRLP